MKDFYVEAAGISKQSIVDIRFHKGVNEHGEAKIRCIVENDAAEKFLDLSTDITWASIKIGEEKDKKANTTIFSGIVSEVSVGNVRGITEVELSLIGSSVIMDLQPVTRTYQKDESKLSNIVSYIKNKYKGDIMLNKGNKCEMSFQPENELLVQYNETDYAFLKRCASLQGVPLITSINSTSDNMINVHLGLPLNSKGGEIESKYYKRGKQLFEYINAKKHGLEKINEDDYSVIEVCSREYFDLGDKISIDGKTMYVYAVDSIYGSSSNNSDINGNKDEFWHTYTLVEEKRFVEKTIYNYDMIGASLQADVKKVNKDKVQIDTKVDNENKTKAKENVEFPFATVYSTKDGTGWYCMPEEGDSVRLYFPSENEKDAYVISAVHLMESNGLRNDPESKYIMNKYKKKVEFTKDSIVITNNKGMEIKLDDSKGISIISDKDISLNAAKEINIISNNDEVNISGKSAVTLKQGTSAYMELKGKATIKATSVHI